jgi:K+-sensing histidine kinase KdpD
LGLPIARGIVEAHGGSLEALPVGRGACFVVTLPCEPPTDSSDARLDASWSLVEAAKGSDGV